MHRHLEASIDETTTHMVMLFELMEKTYAQTHKVIVNELDPSLYGYANEEIRSLSQVSMQSKALPEGGPMQIGYFFVSLPQSTTDDVDGDAGDYTLNFAPGVCTYYRGEKKLVMPELMANDFYNASNHKITDDLPEDYDAEKLKALKNIFYHTDLKEQFNPLCGFLGHMPDVALNLEKYLHTMPGNGADESPNYLKSHDVVIKELPIDSYAFPDEEIFALAQIGLRAKVLENGKWYVPPAHVGYLFTSRERDMMHSEAGKYRLNFAPGIGEFCPDERKGVKLPDVMAKQQLNMSDMLFINSTLRNYDTRKANGVDNPLNVFLHGLPDIAESLKQYMDAMPGGRPLNWLSYASN